MAEFDYNCAVLVACHNRQQKTLNFLKSFYNQEITTRLQMDVYLLDDGSTDGTAYEVQQMYPEVRILTGTGNLFWAGAMRSLWKHVLQKSYDLYLLCNDDVTWMNQALERFINNYKVAGSGTILIGSTISWVTKKMTYGGHRLNRIDRAAYKAVQPDKTENKWCHLGNANIFMVDAEVVSRIGIFSEGYTHYLADYDYTLRAYKAGLKVLVAPGYYGYCEDDHGVSWLSGKSSLKERIAFLYSPKGLAYNEYLLYIKKHFPANYVGAFTKLWLKTLFPFIWDKFKKGTK
jgi:GT2 family glycosyltransferase